MGNRRFQGTTALCILNELRKSSIPKEERRRARAAATESELLIATALIKMFATCGCMPQARQTFDSVRKPDVVAWNALLMGYAENGEGWNALEMLESMKAERRCIPDSVTYLAALKACAAVAINGNKAGGLEQGMKIHSEASSCMNHFVRNALIDMYAKCHSMERSQAVFESLKQKSVVSWTALLLGYAENGEGIRVLELLAKMKAEGECVPNRITYIAALKACASLASEADESAKRYGLQRGRELHREIGCCSADQFLGNALIGMYSSCGSIAEARRAFDSIHSPDMFAWTSLTLAYAVNGEAYVSLDLFYRMKKAIPGLRPDPVAYVPVLKACSLVGALELGRRLHSEMDEFVAETVACLIDLYGRCGSVAEACDVFDVHPRARDLAAWTALLTGYACFADAASAFDIFDALCIAGVQPDAVMFARLLL